MRTFAFLPSHLEPGQYTLSTHMERCGFQIFWIMHNTYDYHWLLRLGADPRRVLDTTMRARHVYSPQETSERLERLEDGKVPFLNEVVAMDRRLKYKAGVDASRYLAHVEKVVTEFLLANQIQFVSNGRDTALHLACHKICERLGISTVVPTAMRFPHRRFGFCEGYTESRFIELGTQSREHHVAARELLDIFRRDRPIPLDSIVERRNTKYLRRIHTDFIRWVSMIYRSTYDIGNDIGRYSIWRLLEMFFRKRLNALHIGVSPVFDALGSRPYILYGLQMQPESSVDVLASHVSDQKNLVATIAKATPCTHDVYVKPHPDHIGGLSRAELLELKSIPGVRLISPYMRSHDLIQNAALVLTPTGTMAWESAMFGVRSVIFADEYFKELPLVHYCRSLSDLPQLIPHLLSLPPIDESAGTIAFLAKHLAHSFSGRVTTYFGPYDEEEIAVLVKAYSEVYDHLRIVKSR